MPNFKKKLYYPLAFLIPLGLLLTVSYFMQLTPLGNKNLLVSDIGSQYLTFMTYLRHSLITSKFSFYSFSLSLGDNFFPIMAYYLISPFNLLLIFFHSNQVPIALSWIIFLKVATIGLSAAFFLNKIYRNRHLSNLMFSTAYSLCGFIALYFYNLMWLDALILLPLVALGIQNVFYGRNTWVYVFSLLATIITNYYLGYMTCLFSVCYFVYLCILNHRIEAKVVRHYIYASLISALMSSVVLLPTMLGMLQTSKQKINLANFYPLPSFGPSSLIQLGVGGSNYSQRLSHGPEFFVGSLILLLVIMFFLNRNISKRRKSAAAFLIVTLFLSMFIMTFNTIWHMFQQPAGFPFRNSFFLSFVLMFIAYESFQNSLSFKNIIAAASGTISLITIGYLFAFNNDNGVQPEFWLISIVLVGLTSVGLILYNRTNAIHFLLMLTVCLELVINFTAGLSGAQFGSQSTYQHDFRIESKWFNKIKRSDSSFYRIDNQKSLINKAYEGTYNNYNDALLFNTNGLSLYSSTLNAKTRNMLLNFGYYGENVRRISAIGATTMTDALFGVKYRLDMSTHDYDLFKMNALGLGTIVNKNVKDFSFNKNDPIGNQERLWNTMTNSNQTYFVQPNIVVKGNNRITINSQVSGNLYYVNNKQIKTISANNKIFKMSDYQRNNIIDLGKYTKDSKQTIKVSGLKNIAKFKNQLFVLDNSKLQHSITNLNQGQLRLTDRYRSSYIKGTINVKSSQQILLLNIPFDKGWQANVDGKKIPIHQTVGNLSYLNLSKGQHQITLIYHVPGLQIGLLISLLSLMVYLISRIKFFRRI